MTNDTWQCTGMLRYVDRVLQGVSVPYPEVRQLVLQQQWRRLVRNEVLPGTLDRFEYEWRDVKTENE